MEKRALVAIALSFVVLVVWTMLFAPRLAPPRGAKGSAGSAANSPAPDQKGTGQAPEPAPESSGAAASSKSAASESSRATPTPRREAPEGAPPIVVETDLARVEFSSVGGRLVSWQLKKYLDDSGQSYELVTSAAAAARIYPFQFRLADKELEERLNTRARFDAEREPIPAVAAQRTGPHGVTTQDAALHGAATKDAGTQDGSERVRLVYSDGQGLVATKTFVFSKDSYLVEVNGELTRNGQPVAAHLLWGPGIGTPRKDDPSNKNYEGGTAIAETGVDNPRRFSSRNADDLRGQVVRWAGIEEQLMPRAGSYFAAVFIPPQGLAGCEVVVTSMPAPATAGGEPAQPASSQKPEMVHRLSIAVPVGETYTLFAGPKDYALLSSLNRNLTDLVNFTPGVPILGPLIGLLAKLLYTALRWLHSFLPNYGVAIIILTTAVKIVFYPITQRTMVKMRAVQQQMQKIQPKVKAIKDKYKKLKDAAGRAKVNEEIMALYRREGINPMASLGGCLPILLQLPILYGFYRVLSVTIELRQAPFFGWIQDLSREDPLYITPIVMGLSMFLQQKLAMTNVTDPQQRAQQRMMLVMPLVFTVTFLHLPSGLVLYWFVNNILGIVQQVLINRQARALEAEGAAVAGKA